MGGSWYYLFTDFKIKKSFRRGEMELFEYKYDGFGLKKKKRHTSQIVNANWRCRVVQKLDPQTADDKHPKSLLNGDKPDCLFTFILTCFYKYQ